MTAPADVLFELTDAMLCADGPGEDPWSGWCSPQNTAVDTALYTRVSTTGGSM